MKSLSEQFDDLVRRQVQDSGPGGGDWDLPSENVWESIAERIKPEKGRRWGFWWVIAGTLVVSGVFWIALQIEKSKTLPGDSSGQSLDVPVKAGVTKSETHELIEQTEKIADAEIQVSLSPHTDITKDRVENSIQRNRKNVQKAGNSHSIGLQEDEIVMPLHVQQHHEADESQSSLVTSTGESFSGKDMSHRELQSDLHMLSSSLTLLDRDTRKLNELFVSPLIKRAKQHGTWSVAASFSPSLGTRRITVPDAQPRVRRSLLLQQEEPTLQPGFGLSVLHQLHARWSIGLGVEYGSYVLNGSSTQQIRYTRAGERLNARGNFENRLQLHLSTSYGELSTDVVVERSSDAQIEENRFISLALETRHTMQEVRVPLTVGYHLPFGQWKLYSYAGLSANVMIENKLTFRAIQSLNNEIVHTSTSRNVKLSEAHNVVMGYHLGCALEIPLERQWSILAGPSLSGSIEPIHEDRQVKIYPMMVDVDLGVRYRF